MDFRTTPRTYPVGDEPLDRRIVSRGPDLELWQGTTCHAVWTRDEVVRCPSFWPLVNRWLETGMLAYLRHLIDGSWANRFFAVCEYTDDEIRDRIKRLYGANPARIDPDPVRVELPSPRVQGFGEVFRRIGERMDGEKPARIDLNPTVAPGTVRRHECEKHPARDEDMGKPGHTIWKCGVCGRALQPGWECWR